MKHNVGIKIVNELCMMGNKYRAIARHANYPYILYSYNYK